MYGCAYYCKVAGMPNVQSCDSVDKQCEKCEQKYSLEVNEYDDVESDNHLISCQGNKDNNINYPKCDKCNDLIRNGNECQSCLNVKKLFEDNGVKQAKLESDGGLSLQFETSRRLFWEKISVSKLNGDGAV